MRRTLALVPLLCACAPSSPEGAPPEWFDTAAPAAPPAQAIARSRRITQGSVNASPGALFAGTVERARVRQDLNPAGPYEVPCWWSWDVAATRVVDVGGVCPTCTFAFQVAETNGQDELLAAGLPSACRVAVPTARAPYTLAFSQAYGAVLIASGAGVLSVYTYDVSYAPMTSLTQPNFAWRVEPPWRYVY